MNLKWVDTVISPEGAFKRVIGNGKSTLYIKNGIVAIKEKEIPAKTFKKVLPDKTLDLINTFMTFDFETITIEGKIHPYLICGYTPTGDYINSLISVWSREGQSNMVHDFINKMLNHEGCKNVKYVYAHNFSGFDGVFLLRCIMNFPNAKIEPLVFNQKLLSLKFIYTNPETNKKRTIIFKDSYTLLPLALRKLAHAFDIVMRKSYFPMSFNDINHVGAIPEFSYWSKTTTREEYFEIADRYSDGTPWNFKEEAIKYCQLDCKCLYDVLVIFNEIVFKEFSVNIHSVLTLPALAMKIYKSKFMPKDTIYKILGDVERDIRESYTGGSVDVYKPHNTLPGHSIANPDARVRLYYYDANSLYPFVMASLDMPVGKPIAFEGDIRIMDPEAFGFFYCEITTPGLMEQPILQRRIETEDGIRTVAGLGTWKGWLFSVEMDSAISLGYKINIIKGYKFKKQNIFKDYVLAMYELRLKYPKSNPLNLIAKLLMNSLYGKFAMKPYHSVVEMYNMTNEDDMQQLNHLMKTYGESFQDYITIGDHVIIIRKNVANYSYDSNKNIYNGSDVNIAIGSAVTAGGRAYLAPLKTSKDHTIYYSDTDSIVIDKPLDPKLVNLQLGFFKLEYVIKRAIFLAPKVYGFETSNGDTVIKVKGVSKKEVDDMSMDTLQELLTKDSSLEVEHDKWFKDVFEGKMSIRKVAYRLKITSNKRESIYVYDRYLGGDVFTGTRPYWYQNLEMHRVR